VFEKTASASAIAASRCDVREHAQYWLRRVQTPPDMRDSADANAGP